MITPYTFDFRNKEIKEGGGTPIKECPLPYNFYQQEKELKEVEGSGSGENPVPLPVITPDHNPYTDPVTIAITCTDPGASIYWTDDGSTPSAAKTLYTAPFQLSGAAAWTVKAIAINGARTSAIATEVVTRSVVATPVYSQDGGTFYDTVDITITCATAGATIRYTTNGTTPTSGSGTIYSGPVTLDYTTGSILKAIAYKTNYTSSSVKSSVFSVSSYLMYWGASTAETLDRAAIVALANKNNTAFTTSPVTYAFGANTPDKYLYLVMPNIVALQPIADTGFVTGGLSMTGDLATVAPYTNTSNGWTYDLVTLSGPYRVYRTKNLIASAINIVVTRG